MKNSLSVLVPVFNCQSTAHSLVGPVLEVLEELTHRFEFLAIDNGSTDATRETLAELALCYPQLKLVTHPSRSSEAEVMRTGLRHSSGETILYRREGCEVGPRCLLEMWQTARAADLVVAARGRASLAAVASAPAVLPPTDAPAWQMIRRRLLEAWSRQRAESDWLRYLHARGYRAQEVEARSAATHPAVLGPHRSPTRLPGTPPQIRGVRRPNYLDRIKAFALGE
ncbi:MAG TPA: glycosyltransferase [Pirellulales bacterium]